MKTSVIIPAYNSAWCLVDCIRTVIQQTSPPNEILIGVDACPDTLVAATNIRAWLVDRGDGHIAVSIYYFPSRSYPYRIRNTLAMMATGDVLHFFDADDLMYPDHLETMENALGPNRFATARAEIIRRPGEIPEPWIKALGVVSISRRNFVAFGGFEPWRCAADSEAHIRWELNEIEKVRPLHPTMLVRKHDGGLTIHADTGYKSPVRAAYRAEIARRCALRAKYRLMAVDIGHAIHVTADTSVQDTVYATSVDLTPDPIIAPMLESERRRKAGTALLSGVCEAIQSADESSNSDDYGHIRVSEGFETDEMEALIDEAIPPQGA